MTRYELLHDLLKATFGKVNYTIKDETVIQKTNAFSKCSYDYKSYIIYRKLFNIALCCPNTVEDPKIDLTYAFDNLIYWLKRKSVDFSFFERENFCKESFRGILFNVFYSSILKLCFKEYIKHENEDKQQWVEKTKTEEITIDFYESIEDFQTKLNVNRCLCFTDSHSYKPDIIESSEYGTNCNYQIELDLQNVYDYPENIWKPVIIKVHKLDEITKYNEDYLIRINREFKLIESDNKETLFCSEPFKISWMDYRLNCNKWRIIFRTYLNDELAIEKNILDSSNNLSLSTT